ncbi:hypothetical protein Hdeb2414_s0007g00235441 [Helianthus debilis subsp. tardiflorus]
MKSEKLFMFVAAGVFKQQQTLQEIVEFKGAIFTINIDCREIADFKGAIFHHKYRLQVTPLDWIWACPV